VHTHTLFLKSISIFTNFHVTIIILLKSKFFVVYRFVDMVSFAPTAGSGNSLSVQDGMLK